MPVIYVNYFVKLANLYTSSSPDLWNICDTSTRFIPPAFATARLVTHVTPKSTVPLFTAVVSEISPPPHTISTSSPTSS